MTFKAIILRAAGAPDTGRVVATGSVEDMDALETNLNGDFGIVFNPTVEPGSGIVWQAVMLTGPTAVGESVVRDSDCFRPS